MTALATPDTTAQAEQVRRGDVTATELVTSAIERVERLDPALNAAVTPMFDTALAEARGATSPFAGVPVLVKDLVAEIPGVRSSRDPGSCGTTCPQ